MLKSNMINYRKAYLLLKYEKFTKDSFTKIYQKR